MSRIALYRGSFDPPGIHQRAAAIELARQFERVVIVPHGPWPDKPELADTSPIHRASLTDITFADIPGVEVDLSDMERGVFSYNHQLEERFSPEGEVSHVLTLEEIRGGGEGRSMIHREWHRGSEVWSELNFVVLAPEGVDVPEEDLPPRSSLLRVDAPNPSRTIRSMVYHRQAFEDLVVPRAAAYIERHNLFRGVEPLRETRLQLESPRLLIAHDPRNRRSVELVEALRPMQSDDPNLIVVLGGDGTMLHAIRQHWRRRLPFYGINTGHIGFLLNNNHATDFFKSELMLYQLPLLWVRVKRLEGDDDEILAFNDAWVERASGQTAWLRLSVDDEVRLEKLVADGALISTAAGSTSYARAMGATPVPLHTRVLVVAGSNVMRPMNWRPALLPYGAEVEFITLDPNKRPLEGYVDGEPQGRVHAMRARVSRIAAVELAFVRGYDPVNKLTEMQFPPEG